MAVSYKELTPSAHLRYRLFATAGKFLSSGKIECIDSSETQCVLWELECERECESRRCVCE